MCFTSALGQVSSNRSYHYLFCAKILPVRCLYETVRLLVLFANSCFARLSHSAQLFSFKLERNTIRFVINLCLF